MLEYRIVCPNGEVRWINAAPPESKQVDEDGRFADPAAQPNETDGDEDARDAGPGGGIGSVEDADAGPGPVRSGLACPVVLGTRTDPGDGSGPVLLFLRYPEFTGSVTYRLQLPDIGSTHFAFGPGGEEIFSFAARGLISAG